MCNLQLDILCFLLYLCSSTVIPADKCFESGYSSKYNSYATNNTYYDVVLCYTIIFSTMATLFLPVTLHHFIPVLMVSLLGSLPFIGFSPMVSLEYHVCPQETIWPTVEKSYCQKIFSIFFRNTFSLYSISINVYIYIFYMLQHIYYCFFSIALLVFLAL